ncbi:SDR family oxidoreductase [Streptomyces sp. 6N223]|uniref:SDR family oxidoreductase n=1 Tax=Streptomyces sp. 6N223 TaxID=3457412 RepID=UPI003FD6A866
MRVFVTGATGFIGSAVVRELIDTGHQVVGLARSDEAAASLTAAGVGVHRGSLDDLDSLRAGAAASDGVIHLAYIHDFANITASGEVDRRAVEAFGDALAGSGRPLVIASGTLAVARGGPATEDDPLDPSSHRTPAENAAIAQAERGVGSSAVRLPPTVHGRGDHGFVPALIGIARDRGVSAYIGDGTNRWPAVHRLDAARLFRRAVESAPAGTRLHGVAEEGIPFRDIATAIGRHLNLPVAGVSPEEADAHFGWMAAFASLDRPTSSEQTRKLLEWQPEHPALLADLAEGHYVSA